MSNLPERKLWLEEYGVHYRHLEGDHVLGDSDQDVRLATPFEYEVLHVPTGKKFLRRIAVCFRRKDLLELLDGWNARGHGTWVHWSRPPLDKRFVLVEPGAPCDPLESGGYSTSGMVGMVGPAHLKAYLTEGSRPFEALLPGERSGGAVARHGLQGACTVDVVRVA